MPTQVSTAGATSGNVTQYEAQYYETALETRTYDQFATPLGKKMEPKGLSAVRGYLGQLLPRPSTAQGSELVDFEPQTIRDTSRTITKVYIADGLQAHKLATIKSSWLTERDLQAAVAQLGMMTIDALARRKATENGIVYYGGSTEVSARATCDRDTAGHYLHLANFTAAQATLASYSRGKNGFMVCDTYQYADLLSTASTAMINALTYNTKGMEILFNFEMAELAGFRIVVSPFAKVFYGAGAANASVVNTSIASSATANVQGATTIEVGANTNIVAGMWLTVGSVQTGAETDASGLNYIQTEVVRVKSTPTGTTVNIIGKGPGHGLLYDHAVGATVKNADSVHSAVFGTETSLVVDFQEFGRYGKPVPIHREGHALQWGDYAFEYYGAYDVFEEGGLFRCETSASRQ